MAVPTWPSDRVLKSDLRIRQERMLPVNIGDLLDRVADCEERFKSYLVLVRDRSRDNGVRLVTYCLALHWRHQKTILGGLNPELLQRARKAKLKAGVAPDPSRHIHVPETAPDKIGGRELLDAAIGCNNELVSICCSVLSQPVDDDVREVLEEFVMVKERDTAMLKKMRAMNYF